MITLWRAARASLECSSTLDKLGPPHAVRQACDAWGSNVQGLPKGFLELGQATGAQEDYGHGDLAVGCRLADELCPLVASFMGAEHPPRIATRVAGTSARAALTEPALRTRAPTPPSWTFADAGLACSGNDFNLWESRPSLDR